MRSADILTALLTFYVLFRALRALCYRTTMPKHTYVIVLYLLYPSLTYLLWLFPHKKIHALVYPVYGATVSWTFFFVAIMIWAAIKYLYVRSHRVRMFFIRHRRSVWKIIFAYFFLVLYVRIVEYFEPDRGTCKALTPYEYFKQPQRGQGSVKTLAVFFNILMVSSIFVGSCEFFVKFQVSVAIA